MVKRILVPLDSTEASEAIVPIVAALARDAGSTVRLLRVYPVPDIVVGPHGRTVAYADQEMARLTSEGLDDLRRAEERLHGVPTECVVRFGEPAEEIVLEADAFGADLIALAAAKRGRLRAALRPGVAERIGRRTTIPALLLQA